MGRWSEGLSSDVSNEQEQRLPSSSVECVFDAGACVPAAKELRYVEGWNCLIERTYHTVWLAKCAGLSMGFELVVCGAD